MINSNSILLDIKQKIGPSAEYEYFDVDIIDAINTALAILEQIGVGEKGFAITDDTATWSDFHENVQVTNMARTYVYNKVRLIFDPPNNTLVADNMEKQNEELECRMSYIVDDQTGAYM